MDERQKEVAALLKELGCGEVEIGPDFTVKQLNGRLYAKETTKETKKAPMMVAGKTEYGSIIAGTEDGQYFRKVWIPFRKIIKDIIFQKSTIGLIAKIIQRFPPHKDQ